MALTWKEAVAGQGERVDRPVVRDYRIVCLLSLLILTLVLLDAGYELWSLLPLLLGGVGIIAHWVGSPMLVLFSLMLILLKDKWLPFSMRSYTQPSLVSDLLLAASTLIYLASAMRLLTLARHALPPDVRRSLQPPGARVAGRWLLPKAPAGRSLREAPANEIFTLLSAAPAFVLVAYVIEVYLFFDKDPPDWIRPLDRSVWRALLLAWWGGLALVVLHGFLSYLGRAQASRQESLLYLQDQLWRETCGEQRRLNRWIAWARLRKQRKEEAS
jgi:hypothetical protein